METIKDTISQVMKRLGDKEHGLLAESPEEVLKKHLTKRELKHIKIKYFRQGTLGIAVDSSAWLYHLGMQKETLAEKLHKDCAGIKNIKLFVGELQ